MYLRGLNRYRIIFLLFFVQISICHYGQIIADHTVVDRYDDIPQRWIDSVKTKWVVVSGASHAQAYINGCDSLEQLDATYAWVRGQGGPRSYSDQYLRLDKWTWGNFSNTTGWQDWNYNDSWWTTSRGVNQVKVGLQYCNDNGPELFAIWFGWSYDAVWDPQISGNNYDPVYHTRWGGGTFNGPDGRENWGLDSGDSVLTNNRLNMQSYIDTMESYIQYCIDNDIDTRIVYSTGAVDDDRGVSTSNQGESGYQQYLKWEYIRDYINSLESEAYFIDYADILTYNDAGEQATTTWTDNNGMLQTFPVIHPENNLGVQRAHIGNVGALKIAKATWWLLARMAGWDGSINGEDTTPPSVPTGLLLNSASLNSITISWSAASDNVAVTGYSVFRNGVFIGATSESSYSDNILTDCDQYNYTVSAFDEAGNESEQSQGLLVSNCHPDLTSTLIVSPNISHGITVFNVLVRITELNSVNSDGTITLTIPADTRWDLEEGYNSSLEMLNDMILNNSDWTYSRNETNHIFSSSVVIPAGGSSSFGFTIVFNPDTSRGMYTVTSQLVPGSGGEIRSSNNADSERLDYFQ